MTEPTLQLSPPPSPGAPVKVRKVWHLATNQLNLFYMLAGGLITGPMGFGRKYFHDPLAAAPGWIPLFADEIPAAAFEQAVSEGAHLRRTVAALDLARLTGPVQATNRQGQTRELRFPDELNGEETVLWLPAPLPASWIQSILFASKEERVAIEEEAADYANVPIKDYKRLVKARPFGARSPIPWPVEPGTLPPRDRPPHGISARGAAMALSFAVGNSGEVAVAAGRILSDPWDQAPEAPDDPLLRALRRWARLESTTDSDEPQVRLLLETLEAIVAERVDADTPGQDRQHPADTQQAVLNLLEAPKPWLSEGKWQEALNRLAGDLRGILGLGGETVSELLQRHPRPFSRGLIQFFLRERCDELLALRQPLLTELDRVTAAALFGARCGWLGIPAELRQTTGLGLAIMHRMAALEQQARGTGLDLGPAPARVRPLRELLAPAESGWNKRQRDGALLLARGMGWETLIHTRVSLGKGAYRLQVDGRGVHLLLDGEPKAVTTEVDRAGLLDSLAGSAVPARLDAKVRTLLKA